MVTYSSSRPSRWLMLLPVVVLCMCALNQARLHAANNLSSWRGGGFGMFATVDRDYMRSVHVTITTNTGEVFNVQWASVTQYFNADASRSESLTDAKALPSPHNVREIALILADLTWKTSNNELVAVKDNSGNKFQSSSFAVTIYGVTYDKETNQVTPDVVGQWRGDHA